MQKKRRTGTAHSELGLLLIKTGQWQGALTEMKAAVACVPASPLFHFQLAAVYMHLKQLPEASSEYEKALAIDPGYFEANLMYGSLLLSKDHADAGLSKLTRAVNNDPNFPEAHAFLAEAYEKLGPTRNSSEERAKAAQLKANQLTEPPPE